MSELIQAWTRAGNAIADYFEKAGSPLLPFTAAPVVAAAEPAAAPAKVRASKKEKAPAPELPAPTASPADILPPGPALPDMTEEQSAKAVYEVCAAFVQRFAKATPDGRTAALAILAEQFKVAAIKDLVHSQRLQFISALKTKIADADKA